MLIYYSDFTSNIDFSCKSEHNTQSEKSKGENISVDEINAENEPQARNDLMVKPSKMALEKDMVRNWFDTNRRPNLKRK